MTCIVGYVDKGIVHIGGDRAAVGGSFTMPRVTPKVFELGEFLIGYTSSFRMGDLLEHSFMPPFAEKYDRKYMCTNFVNELRSCFKNGGYTRINSNEESGGTFLVGVRGTLFEIENDFQVAQYENHFMSVGCGQDHAMGALYALEKSKVKLSPKEKIIISLEAASAYSGWVCAPYDVISTKPKTESSK